MILDSELDIRKLQTAFPKHLEDLPKTREGSISAMVWVKIAISGTIIVRLVYNVMWCYGSMKYDAL